MATPPIQWREPQQFAAGDTLLFQRSLPDHLPSDGWAIRLTISSQDAAAPAVAQVLSVPDSTNQFHTFTVPNFLAGVNQGTYTFSEEIVNSGTGEKHQIYFSDNFEVGQSLDSQASLNPVKTHAQIMLDTLEASLLDLAQLRFQETDVQRNRFVSQKQAEVLDQWKYWKAFRQNEIQADNVRNGRASGAVSVPIFRIG